MYIFQSSIPEESTFATSMDALSSMKRYLSKNAFLRRLTDLRPDDMFVYSDPEELIRPEILLFLKLYDGYTEPITFEFRRSVFGYFWTVEEEKFGPRHMLIQDRTSNPKAASLATFRDLYGYDASFPGQLKKQSTHVDPQENDKAMKNLKNNIETENSETRTDKDVQLFKISEDAGWKCLWCYKPENIRSKLLSIPPKYLDMVSLMIQENSELENIRGFIKYGVYFDKSFMRGGRGTELSKVGDSEYAPNYILNDANRFSYLLVNPYAEKKDFIQEENLSNKTIVTSRPSNYSMVDALDNKIKNYWYSLFDNSSVSLNNTLSDKIDEQFKSYWNSIRNKILPSYIKWTQ